MIVVIMSGSKPVCQWLE